jgi:hypothetical protein
MVKLVLNYPSPGPTVADSFSKVQALSDCPDNAVNLLFEDWLLVAKNPILPIHCELDFVFFFRVPTQS